MTALSDVATNPATNVAGRPHSNLYLRVFKRGLDVAFVLIAAPVVLFLIAVLALWIRRDGGPAFYCQERVGQRGRLFRMWKLRSMVVDADTRLLNLLERDPEALLEWTEFQKLKHDPRITKVGEWIRKTSFDELPQLWNVLIGDMSLVGPRPFLPSQTALYSGAAYYSIRPGLTGYWQLRDRNGTSFASRALHDEQYCQDVSLLTDLRLLAATVLVVMRRTGV
jgi:lipopolysaccharide/colanic/teichoic acid biosynthesis glycosyltransferase